jgi:small-conductance mechanosensitive channel
MIIMSFGVSIAEFLNQQFEKIGINTTPLLGEIIVAILIFLISIICGWIVYNIFEKYLTDWAGRTKTTLDDEILINIKKPIYFFVFLFGLYYAIEFLTFFNQFSNELRFIFSIAEILLITFIITRVVNVTIVWYSEKRAKKKMSEHILFVLKKIINAFIFLFAFLIILYVLKIDLSGIIVGLGVGGIAIAFALQNVLSDLFSAFSIYFDKPFEIGDYIVVGDYAGTVKKIGMKSTRIQLLQGEELVMANSVLTTTSVRNYKKMRRRRIVFHFGITYDTNVKKIEKIPEIVNKIIEKNELAKPDRIHFKEFGDSSLNFEVVYYMKVKDYDKYLNTQQYINLAILKEFEKEGIEMAYPTQTIYLQKEK